MGSRYAAGASSGTTGLFGATGVIRRYNSPWAGRGSSSPLFGHMKLILAIIKPFKLDEVREALTGLGIAGMLGRHGRPTDDEEIDPGVDDDICEFLGALGRQRARHRHSGRPHLPQPFDDELGLDRLGVDLLQPGGAWPDRDPSNPAGRS